MYKTCSQKLILKHLIEKIVFFTSGQLFTQWDDSFSTRIITNKISILFHSLFQKRIKKAYKLRKLHNGWHLLSTSKVVFSHVATWLFLSCKLLNDINNKIETFLSMKCLIQNKFFIYWVINHFTLHVEIVRSCLHH